MKMSKISHVRIGDRVKIITGDQKGLIGNISSLNKKRSTAVIDSVPTFTKVVKKQQEKTTLTLNHNIHISNLMLWDNEANLSSRIGYKFENEEKKRYYKKSGNIIATNSSQKT